MSSKPSDPSTPEFEPLPGDPPLETPTPPLSDRDQAFIEGPLVDEEPQQQPDTAARRGEIGVATCQFAVSSSLRRNAEHIVAQIRISAEAGARIVHFPESALTGYLGRDHDSWTRIDPAELTDLSAQISAEAANARVWVLLGSLHILSEGRLPHNSVFVIDDHGRLVDRYDKRFCTTNDLLHYTPGSHRVTFEVDGVRCGVAICFDIRFPEIYREYKAAGVECIFQSNYDARGVGRSHFRHIMRQTMQTRCATNFMWMSASNSSAHYQSYPSVFIRPDGRIAARLHDHRPGVMVNHIDLSAELYDAAGEHRQRALHGSLGNGEPFFDRRSVDRQRW